MRSFTALELLEAQCKVFLDGLVLLTGLLVASTTILHAVLPKRVRSNIKIAKLVKKRMHVVS